MNTINTSRKGKVLNITIQGSFNLHATKLIKNRLTPGINKMTINLINCDLIDSEGVIFLHRWLDEGNELQLKEPPTVLFEILEVLELDDSWNLENILTN